MSELKTSIIVDLKGNLDRQLKKNTQSINRFSRNGIRDLGAMDKKTRRLSGSFGKLAGRLTGAALAYKAFKAAGDVIDFDANVTQLQTSGNYSDSEIEALKSKVIEVANQRDIRLSPEALLAAVQKVIELTGDKKFAMANIRNLALAARATDSNPVDVASVISTLYETSIRTEEAVNHALDGMVRISEAGAVGFKDIARVGPELLTIASGLGVQGEAVTADLTALAQIARKSTGSAEKATTASVAFGMALLKEDIQQKLASRGVHVRNKNGSFKPLSELLIEINNSANRDMSKLATVFDSEVLKVFKGLNNEGNTELLRRLSSIRGDGSEIAKDALKNASTAKASLQAINNKGGAAADTLFSKPTKDLANAFNSGSGFSAFDNLNMATVAIADSITGYSAFKHYFDAGIQRVVDAVAGKPLTLEEYAGKNKIELEVTDKRIAVKSITSDNLDIEVDTGQIMGAN